MGGPRPLVSVLVVTRNRAGCLRRCLESVAAQTYSPLEMVVVDNGSEDNTLEMVRATFSSARVVALPKNIGCPPARNVGFTHCAGEYIYQLDDDGWLDSLAIERAVATALSQPRIGAVMSRRIDIEGGKPRNEVAEVVAGQRRSFAGGCTMLARQALQECGYYNNTYLRQGEETELSLMMLDSDWTVWVEPESIMYHEASPVGRVMTQIQRLGLSHTLSTATRLLPFPWAIGKIAITFVHSVRIAVRSRSPHLPLSVAWTYAGELPELLRSRTPVRKATARMFFELR